MPNNHDYRIVNVVTSAVKRFTSINKKTLTENTQIKKIMATENEEKKKEKEIRWD